LANNSLDLVSLDFNALKASFRNYLRGNPQFSDFDFEGSNMNLLLELLAYNTHKNAFFLNMVLSESFLDSAQLRNSVFSHAKELNYLPISKRSSKAKIKVTFEASGENAPYIIQKGSPFTAIVKNDSFTFTIPENITVASANNTYTFTTDIYEGVYLQDTYNFQANDIDQKFKITNKDVDTTSLVVYVYEDGNENYDIYTRASSLLGLKKTSKVYFLQPTELGFYEVLFGDNNLGRRPKTDSIIVLEYRTSSGEIANGAKIFTLDFDPTGNDELTATPEVNTLQNSKSGTEEQSLESIKYIAPRHFQTQERAVTSADYAVSLQSEFPEINNIYAFGGEDMNPPEYGRVYISLDLDNIDGLPDSKVTQYTKFIKNRSPFGIIPKFIQPEYTYLQVNSKVRYNINITSDSSESIRTLVADEVKEFRDENLDTFNVTLRQSKLEAAIDDADNSIISSITDVKIYKKFTPTLGTPINIITDFGVPLYKKLGHAHAFHPFLTDRAVTSSIFYYNSEIAIIEDDGFGNVRILRLKGTAYEKILDVGTVDYDTGKITIDNIKIDSYEGGAFKIIGKPADPDVVVSRNNILTIEDDEINIEVEQIRE
jgi:hypothetical protein